ncbi:MAG: hypothetical protein KKB59_20070 [Spirochaetes bacterium]|nr:hypothetical protein [Spirochaetota bacterium]
MENKLFNQVIMRTGPTNDGRFEFKLDDLKKILDNTKLAIDDGHKVPLLLGHNDRNEVAKGFLTNIRLENERLLADIENIPNEVYNEFQTGRLHAFSVHISPKFKKKDGTDIGLMINDVAALGISRPALHLQAMADLDIANFSNPPEDAPKVANEDDFLSTIAKDNIELSAKLKHLEEENIKLTAENAKMATELRAYNDIKDKLNKEEAENFVSGLIKERKILPSEKDVALKCYLEDGKEKCLTYFGNRQALNDHLFREWTTEDYESGQNVDEYTFTKEELLEASKMCIRFNSDRK